MPSFSNVWTNFFPPTPTFSDKDLPDLTGKTYIVTGASSGIGKATAEQLYKKNAKVYIATRNEGKAQNAIKSIKELAPGSTGSLIFLHLDLGDLNNVKAAAETFLAQESSLHTLFNNAGTMVAPVEPPLKTVSGYELALGVNCVGTFLFTELLTPILTATAKQELPHSVRIVWLSSYALELSAHKDVGLSTDNLDYHKPVDAEGRYGLSKAGVWALGVEFARRYKDSGIVSVPINPGNLSTELPRDQPFIIKLIAGLVCYPADRGAITELFAAFSPEAAAADLSKSMVGPFGRVLPLREDLTKATQLESEGGSSGAYKFWEWCEEQVKKYAAL